jgi:hypothetical protein
MNERGWLHLMVMKTNSKVKESLKQSREEKKQQGVSPAPKVQKIQRWVCRSEVGRWGC